MISNDMVPPLGGICFFLKNREEFKDLCRIHITGIPVYKKP